MISVRKHYTGGVCDCCGLVRRESLVTAIRGKDSTICFSCVAELRKAMRKYSQPNGQGKSGVNRGKAA